MMRMLDNMFNPVFVTGQAGIICLARIIKAIAAATGMAVQAVQLP